MTEQCKHLSPSKREILLNLLKIFEDLFNRTLDMRNTAPVDLEFKDDAKSVCLRPYPVRRVHDAMFRKGVERLLKIGAIE